MRKFIDKYWTWIFVLVLGPVLEYLTYKYHLQSAPVSPILPFFVLVLFLPPWQATIGFLVAVSYTTITLATNPHADLKDTTIRLLILLFFAGLIFVVKDRLDKKDKLLLAITKKEKEAEELKIVALEESLRMRDQFLSIAAHELKTPVSSIILYTDLLEENFQQTTKSLSQYLEFFEDQKEIIEKAIKVIQRQSTTISRLINQFLDISVIKHGRIMLIKEPFSLSKLLDEVCSLSQLQTTTHRITQSYARDIYLNADKIRIEQIMINLLNNAVKYSPDGGDINVKAEQINGSSIRISVRDYGLGIPEDAKDKIFTKFFRAHKELVPNGLGLGLYLSREIVTQHDGIIMFDSPEGGGTRFTVVLPP